MDLIYGGFTVLSGAENILKTSDCILNACIKESGISE